MNKKIASELLSKLVKEELYEGTEVQGNKTYIVKTMCMHDGNPDEVPQEYSFQTNSPEQAKTMAQAQAAKAGAKSCKIQDVSMVPDSGEELQKMGSGSSLNADKSATDGQVMPTDVSKDLPNDDAKA